MTIFNQTNLVLKTKRKHTVLVLLSIFIILFLLTFGSVYYIENKIENTLKKELSKDFDFDDFQVDINSISGDVFIENLSVKKKNEALTHISLANLDLKGLSIYQLVFSNNLIINNLNVQNLKLSIEENSTLLQKDTTNSKQSKFKINNIELKKINIDSINVQLVSSASNVASLKIENMSLDVSNLKLNQDSEAQTLPFEFEEFSLKQGKLTFLVGEFNELSLKEMAYLNNNLEIIDLSFQTIFDKAEFSTKIKTEQDHYSLSIPRVKLLNFKTKKVNNVEQIKSSKLIIDQPNLEVYRDKQVADDISYKPLYSKKLRESSFLLTIDSAEINNAQIKYDERIEKDIAPGQILFRKLSANITNLSNAYKAEAKKTNIKLKGIFMKETPIDAEWSFDVNNHKDEFSFKAALGSIKVDNFNNFSKTKMNLLLEGKIDQVYLNIYGNNESSLTSMRLTYHDLKIKLLNKKGKTKKLLTTITNLFVKKDNEKYSDKDLKANAKRIKHKSFFNFIWVSIKSALAEMI